MCKIHTHTYAQYNVIVAIIVADTQTDLMITILVRWNQRVFLSFMSNNRSYTLVTINNLLSSSINII